MSSLPVVRCRESSRGYVTKKAPLKIVNKVNQETGLLRKKQEIMFIFVFVF